MSDNFIWAGIIVGTFIAVSYAAFSIIYCKTKPQMTDGVVSFLTAAAFIAGIKACVLSITVPEGQGFQDSDRIYFFLGGLAEIWVSLDALWGLFSTTATRHLKEP